MKFRGVATALVCVLSAGVGQAQDCGHSVTGVPEEIKGILSPAYAGEADLQAIAKQMNVLMLEAAHCQAAAQSIIGRSRESEAEIVEWHSLNQWLYRLTNFVNLNANGDNSIDWRDEFKVFAEVYELAL